MKSASNQNHSGASQMLRRKFTVLLAVVLFFVCCACILWGCMLQDGGPSPNTGSGETDIQTTGSLTTKESDTSDSSSILPPATDTGGADSENTVPPDPNIPDAEKLQQVMLTENKEQPGDDAYIDKLIFFGDSTTYGMRHYKVFGEVNTPQVWTPSSGTLALFRATTDKIYYPDEDTELSLADICAAKRPDYLIITLGINGISSMKEEYFKSEYIKVVNIVKENSPDTKIILQSIYPVAKNYTKISNSAIREANSWVVDIAYECQVKYLDTFSALVGSDGYLPDDWQNGDGMHLNEAGFAAIMEYVRLHPYRD